MNKIDRHIGSRIRLRRKILKMSQYSLALDIGISFQQLQKYESGKNRISVSRLYEISKILEVSPYFFFEGLDGVDFSIPVKQDIKTLRIIEIINNLKDEKMKDNIINLIVGFGG